MLIFLGSCLLIGLSGVIGGANVTLQYQTHGKPTFYEKDMLEINCSVSNFKTIQALYLSFRNNVSDIYTGCAVVTKNMWTAYKFLTLVDLHGPSTEKCVSLFKQSTTSFQLEVSGTIKRELLNEGKFSCQAHVDNVNTPIINTDNELVVPDIQNRSHDVHLTTSPLVVVEGKPFTIQCSPMDSHSAYKYGVIKDGEQVFNNTFTPTAEDRGGMVVFCTDSAHPGFESGYISTQIRPHYIFAERKFMSLQRNLEEYNEFICNVTSSAQATYTWKRYNNGTQVFSSNSSNILWIEPGSTPTITVEQVECHAFLMEFNEVAPVIVTYNVTWQNKFEDNVTWQNKFEDITWQNKSTSLSHTAFLWIAISSLVLAAVGFVAITAVEYRRRRQAQYELFELTTWGPEGD